jgi:DNA-binding IclR family transcriptional regulator
MKQTTSVDKALEILLLLSRNRRLGVREIARTLDMSAPTVYRLLTRLAAHGLAQQVHGSHDYKLGWACLELARNAIAEIGLAQVGADVARDLRDSTRETVTIQVPAGRDHVCVVEVEGLDEIRRRVGIGRRMPLHAGASGRAILAFMTPAEIAHYLETPLEHVTPLTNADRARVEKLLEQTRAVGFAVSRSESVVGAVAVSAPCFGPGGRIEGSISVSGPESRLTPEVVNRFTPHVIDAARRISRNLGQDDARSRTSAAPAAS